MEESLVQWSLVMEKNAAGPKRSSDMKLKLKPIRQSKRVQRRTWKND